MKDSDRVMVSNRVAGVIPSTEMRDSAVINVIDMLSWFYTDDPKRMWLKLNLLGKNERGGSFVYRSQDAEEAERAALLTLAKSGLVEISERKKLGVFDVRILKGPQSYGSGAQPQLAVHVDEFVTEHCLMLLFRNSFSRMFPKTWSLVPAPVENANMASDAWIKSEDGELIPVEAKKFDFDFKALWQLKDYMIEHHCKHGIAVATSLSTSLPGNVAFFRYDTKKNRFFLDIKWETAYPFRKEANSAWRPTPRVSRSIGGHP